MSIEKIIELIESKGRFVVLDIYDFGDSYLAACENRITKSRESDYFMLIHKSSGKMENYNPAVDPFLYYEKMSKAKVLYSK